MQIVRIQGAPDAYRLAQFWSQLTGFIGDADNGNAAEDPEAVLLSPDGRLALLFIAVREQKQVKNRVHLDLVPVDRRRDEEVERLLGLGARVVDEQRRSDGAGWVVLLTRRGTSSASSAATSNARPGSSRSAALSQRLVT